MGTIHRFPASQSLDPADLEIAASVYVEAIGRLCPPEGDEACRERIAQSIIDRCFWASAIRSGCATELWRRFGLGLMGISVVPAPNCGRVIAARKEFAAC
jgi:hypothetical protein